MTKDEIKELQANLISLVPCDIRKAKELTKSDKILLGQLVFLYGMNKAKENGYVFRSNTQLEDDTQLSRQTVKFAINRLLKYGAINRTVGSRADGASVYTLNFNIDGDENEAKSSLKIIPKNHPYVSRAEFEAMIEGLRAEYEQQISELRDELATLKRMKSAESSLKIIPNQAKIIPQIQNSEKETTNHSVPEGNYREGNIYTRPDEAKNDEAVETVGSVCDFQKNRVEETTPNATANEIETPKAKVTPEERVKELDNLQLWKMQTPNVDPIEIATELGEILTNEMYQSQTYTKAATVGAYLAKYANDIDTLNQIEKRLLSAHTEKYGHGHSTIDYVFNERRKELANQTANKADQSVADNKDKETIIKTAESDQRASQRANQGSGDIDSIPHDGETSQTSENKASGSVSAPQMVNLSTQEEKTRQMRPESPTMAMEKDSTVEKALSQMEKANDMYYNGEDGAASLADQTANNIIRYIPKINTLGKLNWCRFHINRAFEEWGWALESQATFYLDFINRRLDKREAELRAA